jgi:hypothetical protein
MSEPRKVAANRLPRKRFLDDFFRFQADYFSDDLTFGYPNWRGGGSVSLLQIAKVLSKQPSSAIAALTQQKSHYFF